MSEEMEIVKTLDENRTKVEKNKKKRQLTLDDTDDDNEGQDELEEPKPESKSKPKVNLFEPEILEGKREKKTTQRLFLTSKPKEKLKIESTGEGAKLGDIARVNHSIGKLHVTLLRPLHKLLYDRPGTASTLRKNLRLFNGFSFEEDSDPYNKKMEKLKKLPKGVLKTTCQILDLERSGTQVVLLERIMKFLIKPTNSGKPVLKKRKKANKDAKREKSSSKSKKPQKKVESGKSKPIVTDSSSDDDDDDDEDEEDSKKNSKSTEKSANQNDSEEKSSDTEEEEDDEDEDGGGDDNDDSEEDEKSTKKEKKSSTKKSGKAPPQKKKAPSVKTTKKSDERSDQTASDDSEQDFQEEKKTKAKPAAKRKAPAKPVPQTKKADSSSNRGKKTARKIKDESESSDDDQPLVKIIKKPPTDEQLKETIQELLKDANLEEVTMKQITRQVYDKYPDFDLTSRKELIRETVKNLLS